MFYAYTRTETVSGSTTLLMSTGHNIIIVFCSIGVVQYFVALYVIVLCFIVTHWLYEIIKFTSCSIKSSGFLAGNNKILELFVWNCPTKQIFTWHTIVVFSRSEGKSPPSVQAFLQAIQEHTNI